MVSTEPPKANVIIVGLGLGGLAAAIECRSKGHKVIAIDQQSELKPLGDSIGIPHNAKKIVEAWGNGSVHEELQPLINRPDLMEFLNTKDEVLASTSLLGYSGGNGYPCHRGELVMAFYRHAVELGVDFRLGHRVTDFWEDDDQAGVVLGGDRISADCVIAADGVHSKARGTITGSDPTPHSSGYAIYRAWFDGQSVKDDPETQWLFENCQNSDSTYVYIGTDIHIMIGTGKAGQAVFWQCTHKDVYNVTESWSEPGSLDDALTYIADWPEHTRSKITKIWKKTPKDFLIDFKLLWRDPLPTWVSPLGRMMVIGDAAHPFLPTSGQGAAQAIEDAATFAVCLNLGGKNRIKEVLAATQAIRYERATVAQRLGIETRDMWHKTDWDMIGKNPQLLAMPQPDWLFGHDCKGYAAREFESVVETLKKGERYVPTNIPAPDAKELAIESKQFMNIKAQGFRREQRVAA